MKYEKIKALYKEPGKAPMLITVENELHALQRVIGGNLESHKVTADCCMLCDEEGRLKGLPFNCHFANLEIVGPILLVGVDGEEFCDIPDYVHGIINWMWS